MASLSPDRALLKQAEVEAERVVSLLRILVSIALLVVFFLTVFDGSREVAEYIKAQWLFAFATMLSYLALGVFTLILARAGKFRGWMVWPGVTLDCAFMLLNAWVGLENMAIPGALTFVLPPIWLVPTVLALGLLRFNPYLQTYCVALICFGLGAMVLWQPDQVTTDLVERTRSLVAMPPNAIRLAMIAIGGGVLVVAAWRMRVLLHSSLIEAQARANLTRYLPAQLADRMALSNLDDLRQGCRQEMGILFVDIRGFTSWSEGRDPQEVGELITEFRRRVQKVADANGGLIDKYIGDAAMVLFDGPDGAERLLHCAIGLEEELCKWSTLRIEAHQDTVAAGIGVHWGEVFVGVVGDAARLEYSVFGDTVNTAARLETLTKEQGVAIIASEAVFHAARISSDLEDWVQLPAVKLRGRRQDLSILGKKRLCGN